MVDACDYNEAQKNSTFNVFEIQYTKKRMAGRARIPGHDHQQWR